ncbi:MAG TPA: metallophosphoesterase family protein [Fibrobacteria bacterium]|nr:metallophosphoesterase family protein [Fibrobacteria bacterium]
MTRTLGPIGRIGLISDTHGLLRPEALELLRGSDLILHAGDIGGKQGKGGREILAALRKLAPLAAIRGNNDAEAWAAKVPERKTLAVNGERIHILHDIGDLDFDPAAAGIRCVVSGHSHLPSVEEENGVLFVNPGSAGPRRFSLPVSLGRIEIRGSRWRAAIVSISLPFSPKTPRR